MVACCCSVEKVYAEIGVDVQKWVGRGDCTRETIVSALKAANADYLMPMLKVEALLVEYLATHFPTPIPPTSAPLPALIAAAKWIKVSH